MTKAELRRDFLAKRKALPADEVSSYSQLIAKHFVDFLENRNAVVKTDIIHTFLPIRHQHEVDTWLLIRWIWEQYPDIQFVASVTDVATSSLTHYLLDPNTPLQINRWGIPEPMPNGQLPIDSSQIDIVLVPLLAFDKQGHRVGYGGGFYDRFLANCRPDCLKIGLSLFDAVDRITDVEPTDIPLDACVSPFQINHNSPFNQ